MITRRVRSIVVITALALSSVGLVATARADVPAVNTPGGAQEGPFTVSNGPAMGPDQYGNAPGNSHVLLTASDVAGGKRLVLKRDFAYQSADLLDLTGPYVTWSLSKYGDTLVTQQYSAGQRTVDVYDVSARPAIKVSSVAVPDADSGDHPGFVSISDDGRYAVFTNIDSGDAQHLPTGTLYVFDLGVAGGIVYQHTFAPLQLNQYGSDPDGYYWSLSGSQWWSPDQDEVGSHWSFADGHEETVVVDAQAATSRLWTSRSVDGLSGEVFKDFSPCGSEYGVDAYNDDPAHLLNQAQVLDTETSVPLGAVELPADSGHLWQLRVNSAGLHQVYPDGGSQTSIADVFTGGLPCDAKAMPLQPQWPGGVGAYDNYTLTQSGDDRVLSWPAATDDHGVAGYKIVDTSNGDFTVDVGGNTTSYVLPYDDFSAGNHAISVFAVDGSGRMSGELDKTFDLSAPPSPPGQVTFFGIDAEPAGAHLLWSAAPAPENHPVTHYVVMQGTSSSDATVVATLGPDASTYDATGLDPNVKYWFGVAAQNDRGTGELYGAYVWPQEGGGGTGKSDPSVAVTGPTSTPYGAPVSWKVTVTAQGQPVSGVVLLGEGGTQLGGQLSLDSHGAATVSIPRGRLQPGIHHLVVYYGGNDAVNSGALTRDLTIVRAAPGRPAVRLVRKPASRHRGKAVIGVTTPAGLSIAGGRVTITLVKGAKQKQVAGILAGGRVTMNLPKLTRGRWTLAAAYAGDSRYLPARSSTTLRISR